MSDQRPDPEAQESDAPDEGQPPVEAAAPGAAPPAGDAVASGEPAGPGEIVGPPRDFRRLLRRFGPAVVAIGIAVFASPLADRWPSKQTVEIALEKPTDVTRVTLEVAERGSDPVFAATWNFDPGTAPPRIQAEMTTPNGSYDATIAVVRRGETTRQDELKRVDLDGNRVTLFVR